MGRKNGEKTSLCNLMELKRLRSALKREGKKSRKILACPMHSRLEGGEKESQETRGGRSESLDSRDGRQYERDIGFPSVGGTERGLGSHFPKVLEAESYLWD